MTHTAGFTYGLFGSTPIDKLYMEEQPLNASNLHDMMQRLAGIPLLYQPGTEWVYSVSMDGQGYILEKLTGQSPGEFMEQRIFKPPARLLTGEFGILNIRMQPGHSWGYDIAVMPDPAAVGDIVGKGTYYWSGAADTWFWVDPTIDLIFVGMTQRLLGPHWPDVQGLTRPLVCTITDQEITAQSGVQALSSPSPFTISDMSHVWVMCDVYENDLPKVQLGEFADIHPTAYPDKVLRGHISNIGPILDPNIRTAKVRLDLDNPGILRLGMFVTATFHGPKRETFAKVPSAAILHLHDREWIYKPAGNGYFRRVEVVSGEMLPGDMQQILSGISPGTQIVADALDLQHTASQ